MHQRLKKLRGEGFIKGYLGKIDPEKIGKPLIIWMMVAFESTQDYEGIGKKLAQMPGIMEVHFVGVYSFLLKIRAKNVNEYYQLSTQKIQQIPDIIRVEGLVVYKTFSEKDTFFI